uniref:Pre-C2HC domain-containing protein n=1 Tax=Dendroctonus ponderosae TaxID=77166 RepID=A0AAR5PYR8_DENPD
MTRQGQLAISYKDETQQGLINEKIRSRPELQIQQLKRRNPRLTITGVMKGYSDDELLEAVILEKAELKEVFGDKPKKRFRILRRTTCLNTKKENIAAEAEPEVFRALVRRERIYLDLSEVHIREEIGLALCFNYHRFGHVVKYCQDRPRCHVCGGPHAGRDCRKANPHCPNYATQGTAREDRRHTARDIHCPVYKQKAAQYQQPSVNYRSTDRQ